MEEEKKLDLNAVEENAEEAVKAEEEAKKEPDIGHYTHTFKTPFRWKDREFESLTFDWTALRGRDHLEIEQEVLMKGRTLINPAFTGDFLTGMAVRACTERNEKGKRVIDRLAVMEMDMADFQAITRQARDFLLRAG